MAACNLILQRGRVIMGAKFSFFACMSYFCDVNFES